VSALALAVVTLLIGHDEIGAQGREERETEDSPPESGDLPAEPASKPQAAGTAASSAAERAPTPLESRAQGNAAAPESTTSRPAADQELGVRIGGGLGANVSPGGLEIAGLYLYRLAESDWLESSVGFTYGGSGNGCCDHGLVSGFAGEVSAALRHFFAESAGLYPYASLGLALRLVSYGDNDVRGLAWPFVVGGGARLPLGKGVSLVGGGLMRLGAGIYSDGMGVQPHVTVGIHVGMEFAL
jgi:hypothetical protein